jgi:four helix bundle protein
VSGVGCQEQKKNMSQRPDKIQRFTDLEVWRKSHELFLHLIENLEALPHTRIAAALTHQVIRSTGSIGIAEGFNRSKAKYLNCLDIALGEANETETWLYKLRDSNLFARETANAHVAETIQVEKMLAALYRSIARRST